MNNVSEEKGFAIPDDMTLAQVERSDVVAMLLETAGTLETTEEQRAVLFAKVDPDLVEIREDGIVYLPAVEYKQVLCKVFGTSWAVVPESPKPVEVDGVILWGFYLFIQGQPVAFAWGEQQYKKGDWYMSYGDAMEGAKSNAIMRLCKQIGIAQDLWRPSFIRKWRDENAEEYEGWDRKRNEKKMMWRRLENTGNAEEPETNEASEEEQMTGDTDRFRRRAFLMVEYLQIDEARMKAECKEKFDVDSRAELTPAQWMEYRDYLSGTMLEVQAEDYQLWLDVRSAIKSLTERGMDKKELKFYLQTHFFRLDVLDKDLPEDLAQRLSRSGNSDEYYARLQRAVQTAKGWAESIGGQGKAEELLEHLGHILDDITDTSSLGEFFKNLDVAPQTDGTYRLTDISPAMFEGWKAALGMEDKPKPDPDPPAEAQTIEKQIMEKMERLETEAAGRIAEEKAMQKGGDPTLDALSDVPEEHAEKPTEDTGHDNTTAEPEKEQEQAVVPASKATLARLSELVKTFPGAIYMTVKSNSFKERAAKDIGRTVASIKDYTEQEVETIIGSLDNEKIALGNQDPTKYTEEQLAEAEETGVITDDDPFNQGEPEAQEDTRPATAKENSSWEQQNEIYQLLAELIPNATNKRGDSMASSTDQARQWISDVIGRPSPGVTNLTYDEAPEVILALQDKVSDKRHAAENPPTVV